jgi:DNA-directed RNA polymerase subunit RPC12/RpoP
MKDDLDDFAEFNFTMGADVITCPYCGADVPCSLFFDDEVECPKCGKKFKKDESK